MTRADRKTAERIIAEVRARQGDELPQLPAGALDRLREALFEAEAS